MSSSPLEITVLRDSRENIRKCTLTPLAELEGIHIVELPRGLSERTPWPLLPGILLALDAPPLRLEDRGCLDGGGRLILVDATWARLQKLLPKLAGPREGTLVRRSLDPAWTTAYPRASKVTRDPPGGLASAEALFAATATLGAPRPDLLEGYRWAGEFLAGNAGILSTLGPAGRSDSGWNLGRFGGYAVAPQGYGAGAREEHGG